MAEFILWGSLGLLVYTYLGYPLVLWVWAGRAGLAVQKSKSKVYPSVSIVIAAHNEESNIAGKIENCLGLNYPEELLEVIVVSDGATDGTAGMVKHYDRRRVRLIELPHRMGKAVAVNAGAAAARGEVVVFADARQRFEPSAVEALVSNFSDPHVGAVSGELMLQENPDSPGAEAVGLYWRIEKWIRRKESEINSVIGVTGAIYAIRRELFAPLPAGTILDDLLVPMRIVMRGYRVIFEARAVAYDKIEADYLIEFRRKVRTLAGNYQAVAFCPDLIKPWKNPLFLQFISHKVFRLVAPFCLVALFISNIVLMDSWLGYLLGLQALGYSMALAGWALTSSGIHERWTSAAFAFCLLNFAALVGGVRYLLNDRSLWSNTRKEMYQKV